MEKRKSERMNPRVTQKSLLAAEHEAAHAVMRKLCRLKATSLSVDGDLAEVFAQMRENEARKLAEATPPAGRVLAGPW